MHEQMKAYGILESGGGLSSSALMDTPSPPREPLRAVASTELEKFRDQTRSLEEYRRALIVIMGQREFPAAAIADLMGVSRAHVYNCLKAYRREGVKGLMASTCRGRPRLVDDDFKRRLRQTHDRSPRDFGYARERWTLALLRDHMHRQTGQSVSLEHIRRLLSAPDSSR